MNMRYMHMKVYIFGQTKTVHIFLHVFICSLQTCTNSWGGKHPSFFWSYLGFRLEPRFPGGRVDHVAETTKGHGIDKQKKT